MPPPAASLSAASETWHPSYAHGLLRHLPIVEAPDLRRVCPARNTLHEVAERQGWLIEATDGRWRRKRPLKARYDHAATTERNKKPFPRNTRYLKNRPKNRTKSRFP